MADIVHDDGYDSAAVRRHIDAMAPAGDGYLGQVQSGAAARRVQDASDGKPAGGVGDGAGLIRLPDGRYARGEVWRRADYVRLRRRASEAESARLAAQGGKRAAVVRASSASVARAEDRAHAFLDASRRDGVSLKWLTLTLGARDEQHEIDRASDGPIARMMSRFIRRLRRMGLCGLVRREIQKRGAAHWHMVLRRVDGGAMTDEQCERVVAAWLACADRRTGFHPGTRAGQHVADVRDEGTALARYLANEQGKAHQDDGFRGRRFFDVDKRAVDGIVRSAPMARLPVAAARSESEQHRLYVVGAARRGRTMARAVAVLLGCPMAGSMRAYQSGSYWHECVQLGAEMVEQRAALLTQIAGLGERVGDVLVRLEVGPGLWVRHRDAVAFVVWWLPKLRVFRCGWSWVSWGGRWHDESCWGGRGFDARKWGDADDGYADALAARVQAKPAASFCVEWQDGGALRPMVYREHRVRTGGLAGALCGSWEVVHD